MEARSSNDGDNILCGGELANVGVELAKHDLECFTCDIEKLLKFGIANKVFCYVDLSKTEEELERKRILLEKIREDPKMKVNIEEEVKIVEAIFFALHPAYLAIPHDEKWEIRSLIRHKVKVAYTRVLLKQFEARLPVSLTLTLTESDFKQLQQMTFEVGVEGRAGFGIVKGELLCATLDNYPPASGAEFAERFVAAAARMLLMLYYLLFPNPIGEYTLVDDSLEPPFNCPRQSLIHTSGPALQNWINRCMELERDGKGQTYRVLWVRRQ